MNSEYDAGPAIFSQELRDEGSRLVRLASDRPFSGQTGVNSILIVPAACHHKTLHINIALRGVRATCHDSEDSWHLESARIKLFAPGASPRIHRTGLELRTRTLGGGIYVRSSLSQQLRTQPCSPF
jgi:hypothetical protein